MYEMAKQVKLLVRDERCNLNEKDGSGNAPQLLHWAVRHEDKELVNLLVRDERCNPHEKNSCGDTALHIACRHCYGCELFTICCHVPVVYRNKCVVQPFMKVLEIYLYLCELEYPMPDLP